MTVPLGRRVAKLERQLAALRAAKTPVGAPEKARGEKIWDAFQPFLVAIIPSVVLFWIGYSFQEQFKQNIEERKLSTESTKEIRELVKDLLAENDEAKAVAIGLTIAAFGRYAVLPLISVIESGGVNRAVGARRGLVAASHADRSYTCRILVEILDNRMQRYSAVVHRQIIQTIAQIGCLGQEGAHGEEALRRYRELLDAGPAALADALADVDAIAITNLRAELENARKRLRLDKEPSRAVGLKQ